MSETIARKKASYVGPPGVFLLEQCCQHINAAFGDFGCYLVGSAIERPDWRDVDVRFIMADEEFGRLFPDANTVNAHWEHDPRWLLLIVSITEWMRRVTGLPVDFQIQPQTFANKHHDKTRHAIGLRVAKATESENQ